MSECIIDLKSIKLESRLNFVFYATHDFIIYKDGQFIAMNNCGGEMVARVPCPVDWRVYECLDIGDSIIFVLGGKHFVLFDKAGNTPIHHEIDEFKIGKVITKLFKADENGIVFGTKRMDKIQLVHYDFIGRKRISQSASWQMKQINDIVSANNVIYLLMDNSFIVASSSETCETLWTRFEAGSVQPKIAPYKSGIIYVCQNTVRQYANKKSTNIKTGISLPSALLAIHENKIYLSTGPDVHAYDLLRKNILWHIKGNSSIRQSLLLKVIQQEKEYNVLALRIDNHLIFVNLELGQTAYYSKHMGIQRVRKTDNHLLLHSQSTHTTMIAGIKND